MTPKLAKPRLGAAGLAFREVRALWRAVRRRDVPWTAKAVALAIVAYASMPFDFATDLVPILSWLDDATIFALGVALAMRLIPADIRAEARGEAESPAEPTPPREQQPQ